MKKSSIPLKKRLQAAQRSARWREAHPQHFDTRLLDRMLLESVFSVLGDGHTVPKSVTERLMPAIVDAAEVALAEKGNRGSEVTTAVGRRMRTHLAGRTVKRAMRLRQDLAQPIPCVSP